mgnify:CR=1 FL=1
MEVEDEKWDILKCIKENCKYYISEEDECSLVTITSGNEENECLMPWYLQGTEQHINEVAKYGRRVIKRINEEKHL